MKSILLFANQQGDWSARLRVAVDLARSFDAHLTCLQVTPLDALFAGEPYGLAYLPQELLETYHQRAKAHRAQLESRLAGEGIRWDWIDEAGDPIQSLIDRAGLADLVVLSLPGLEEPAAGRALAFLSEVVLYASTPVFAVPDQLASFDCGGTAIVAWDGSPESAHALHGSCPLLAKAGKVHLVTVSDDPRGLPASDAVDFLSRHGVDAEITEWPRRGERVSDCLLEATRSLRASYLVAGAYGHSRFREAVFGGTTRELIHCCPLPIVLAH